MKRKIMILLSAILCSFAFSAGYRNTYWRELKDSLLKSPNITSYGEKYRNFEFLSEHARILGQPTLIYYTFMKLQLIGISYSIEDTKQTREKLEGLFSSHKLKVQERKRVDFSDEQSQQMEKGLKEAMGDIPLHVSLLEDVLSHQHGGNSFTYDYLLGQDECENSSIEVIKADLDYDTDVHIYKGIIRGQIIFTYTEKSQDF